MRWGMLLVSAWVMLVALGTLSTDMPPSAQCVAVTAVIGVFAPLFWPGAGPTPAQTVLRVGGWSMAAAGLAVMTLLVLGLGKPVLPMRHRLGAVLMLLPILVLTHMAAAGLQTLWGRRTEATDAGDSARAVAGVSAALVLMLAGALPIWLGPVGELLSLGQAQASDLVLALSPLVHLAVASDNDLLRDAWFYQHSNLAALPVSYPGLADIGKAYAALILLPAAAVLAFGRRRQVGHGARQTRPTSENLPS